MVSLFDQLRLRPELLLSVIDLIEHPAVQKFQDAIGDAKNHVGWLKILKKVVYHADSYSQFNQASLQVPCNSKHEIVSRSVDAKECCCSSPGCLRRDVMGQNRAAVGNVAVGECSQNCRKNAPHSLQCTQF